MSKRNEQMFELVNAGFTADKLSKCSDEVIDTLYEVPGIYNYIPKDQLVECDVTRLKALDQLNKVSVETMFKIDTLLTCPVKNMLLFVQADKEHKLDIYFEGASNDDDVLLSGMLLYEASLNPDTL